MKKTLCMLLCAAMLLTMLTACKKQESISDATLSAKEEAEEIKKKLEAAGAKVELK